MEGILEIVRRGGWRKETQGEEMARRGPGGWVEGRKAGGKKERREGTSEEREQGRREEVGGK